MKNLVSVLGICLSLVISLFATERFEIKSGVIEYATTGSGNVMGVETKMTSTSRLAFIDYGKVAMQRTMAFQTIMGKQEMSENGLKIEGDTMYAIDYKAKKIFKSKVDAKDKDLLLLHSGAKGLKQLGGKKVGSSKINGYKCDIWELDNIKSCIYKGVPLRTTSTIMGITQTQIATNIKFDLDVDKQFFVLPNYPITNRSGMMTQARKEFQEKMKNMSAEDKKIIMQMMQKAQ